MQKSFYCFPNAVLGTCITVANGFSATTLTMMNTTPIPHKSEVQRSNSLLFIQCNPNSRNATKCNPMKLVSKFAFVTSETYDRGK